MAGDGKAMSSDLPEPEVHRDAGGQNLQSTDRLKGKVDDVALGTPLSVDRPPNPLLGASLFSRLFFVWPYKLMKLGMERPIEESDLPKIIAKTESSSVNLLMMERLWNKEKERVARIEARLDRRHGAAGGMKKRLSPSLHRAILKDFLLSTWYIQPLMCASSTAKIVQALALGLLLESFESTNGSSEGFLWAGLLVACSAIVLFEHHHVFFITWRKGMQLRIATVAAIYAKSLRLPSTAGTDKASSGKIVNIATNDVERFILAALFCSYLFWAPLQSLAILALGWKIIGFAFAAGYGILLLVVVPLQFYLSQRFATLRSKVAAITDARVTLVSQAVSGVRVMKMSGWEKQFEERIARIRRLEVSQIQRANRLKALNEGVFYVTNVVISIVVFSVHVATGGELTPRNVFTTMALINVVQIEMTKHLSLAVMGVSECYVSIGRIQKFLEYPELAALTTRGSPDKVCDDARDDAISLSDVSCFWNGNGKESGSDVDMTSDESVVSADEEHAEANSQLCMALSDINLDLKMGELICVIGSVGSGKSALIQLIAGELPPSTGGVVRRYETLAYASQDPWIMDGTVEENILMGYNFDREWYNKIVAACGLTVDFEQFHNGDQTIVGDRGVQCSGGQRARIGLARALYRDSDVLLLDDPLSAVDAKVGRLIFHSAIKGLAVKRGKCVVLATHQLQFVGDSKCALMSNGGIKCVGSFSDCVAASGGSLTMAAHNEKELSSKTTQDAPSEKSAPSSEKRSVEDEVNADTSGLDETKHGQEDNTDDDYKEMNISGVVKLDTFLNYARAMGGIWVGVSLILLFTVTQASVLISIASIGRWSEQPTEEQASSSTFGLIFGLGATVIALALLRAFVCFALTIRASRRLHDQMTASVLRAKIAFFDTNPLGRILNRFSGDIGSNDDLLPTTLFDFLMCTFIVLGAIATAISVLPFTLVAIPPLLWYFLRVRKIFVTTSRELKRLEGLARSPIFAMLSESLSGIATIRSNDALEYFKQKFEHVHDAHSRAFFAFISSSRWVGFRMDSLMFVFLSASAFLAVLFHSEGWFEVDPAILGLALSMLLQLAGLFQWCIRQSAEVVNQMVSVERVIGFGNLPSEAPLESKYDTDASNWPEQGSIEVQDLAVRYRTTLPLSLCGVSFRIESGQRVGVVGRTGSGKSTLVQSLFRLLEAEKGKIFVDGVDISKLGLHKLRTHMSVIPQMPVLFSGCTVRENLDPFQKYDDDCIQDALQDVCMIRPINDLPDGLDSLVADGGSNFSVGQRQLLCLARAILRKNKILVLDEPTANVDHRTDQLLQEAVAKSFLNATIIAVAHRLDTVIDYDRILVLGAGEVLEYGTPRELVSKEGGHFSSMVDDTGEKMAGELRRRAYLNE